jgi:hypothetical protein
MKSLLLLVALSATLLAVSCTAPNKFCRFENALVGKKCVALDDQLTEGRCIQLGGKPAKDCGN